MKEAQIQYQAYDFDTGKPMDIVVGERERRSLQKEMLKYNGLEESGRWLEFRVIEAPKLNPVKRLVELLSGVVLEDER